MIAVDKTYTIEDFEQILWNSFHFEVPDNVLKTIQKIADEVGAPNYVKTPIFTKNNNKQRHKKQSEVSEEDWVSMRNFQSTKMVKAEGINKKIEEVRALLNKLTTTNYDKVEEDILKIINESQENDTFNEEEIKKLMEYIFKTASTNSFCSELYAKLVVSLLEFPFIKTIFNENKHAYINKFDNIRYCNPDEDYDLFCEINMENAERKSSSLFLINLMKLNVIVPQEIINIIDNLYDIVKVKMEDEGNSTIIEEIGENLFILITNGYPILSKNNDWNQINANIQEMSKIKAKSKPSISHKFYFKSLDIIDAIKKFS